MREYFRENAISLAFVTGAVALMICIAGAGAYWFFGTGDINEILQDSPFGNVCTQPDEFAQHAEIELPPSTSDLEPLCGGIGTLSVQGTFTMSPDDLNDFISHAGLEQPYSSTDYPTDDVLGFFPDQSTLQSWLYQVHDDPLLFKQILIDTGDPARYRVYVNVLSS